MNDPLHRDASLSDGILHLNNDKKNTNSAICGLLYSDTSASELTQ